MIPIALGSLVTDFRKRKTGRFQIADPTTPSPPRPESEDPGAEAEEPVTGQLRNFLYSSHLKDRYALNVLAGPDAGTVISLSEGEVWVLGRGVHAEIQLNDTALSRKHARLFLRTQDMWIEDLGSTNGTFVNGERITEPQRLRDGDRVQLANTLMKLSLQDALEHAAALQLYESSVRDPLTGVFNRRHLDDRLAAEFAYAIRHGTHLSVLILDIDYFKQVNDTYGHQAGDAVLCVLARTLNRVVRTEDTVARYGGEEFLVMVRGIEQEGSMALGDRIRRAVEKMPVPWEKTAIQVTVSIGVATLPGVALYKDVAGLLSGADSALYEAKAAGRNRVVGHPGPSP